MNVSVSEKRILKLVHPKFVETHSRPVKAADIMSKYPRHSITRPDVFQFPWIVIKPEAILVPGKVFYLVPHRTIRKLLKAAGDLRLDQPFSEQHQSPEQNRLSGALIDMESEDASPAGDCYSNKTHSPLRSSAGSTPKHFGHMKNHKRHDIMSDSHLETCRCSPDDSLPEGSPNCSMKGNRIREVSISGKLKSCFAQQNSNRKLLDLKVTFGSPIIIPLSPRQTPSSKEGPDQSPDGFTNRSCSSHHTMSKLLKSTREGHHYHVLSEQYMSPSQKGFSSTLKHFLHMDYTTKPDSPSVSSAGNTPKHSGHDKNHKRRMMNSPENIAHHSRIGSQNQVNQKKGNNAAQLSQRFADDAISESRLSSSTPGSNVEGAGVSRTGGHQVRSCLRKQNSYRKFLNLEVTFGSPIYIPTSPRESPGNKGSPGACHFYDELYH